MKFSSYISAAALLAVASLTACQDDFENVDNRISDTGALVPTNVLVDGQASEQIISFNVQMANPVPAEVSVTYAVDMSKVEAYNTIYQANAIELPAENYELLQPVATFIENAVTSSNVEVKIKDLLSLDRECVYVLPVTVAESTVPVLESQKTRYIVVRGAALVNVAANMVENNASLVNPSAASALANITEFTFQCIINVDAWGGADSNIQSIAGIESNWLFRVSDSGLPANQLQFVTPSGNITDASWQLKANQFQRLTFTWDASTGQATLYVDGVKKNTMTGSSRRGVSWNSSGFYIGKSYNDNRWLNGLISEVRVWNRILSDAEIADATQPYLIDVNAEGLVAYWKFNEGAGSLIHDYCNGYDLNCVSTPKWVEISLPE